MRARPAGRLNPHASRVRPRCDACAAQNRYEIPICRTGYQRYRDIFRFNSSRPLETRIWLFCGPAAAASEPFGPRPAASSACRHAQRVPRHDTKQACCLTDRAYGARSCRRYDAARVRHVGPPSRGSSRSPMFRCRCVPLPRFIVNISRGRDERHGAHRKACAMRREPARDKRRRHLRSVTGGGIDGNVSGTHLFSAYRERRCVARGTAGGRPGGCGAIGSCRLTVGRCQVTQCATRPDRPRRVRADRWFPAARAACRPAG